MQANNNQFERFYRQQVSHVVRAQDEEFVPIEAVREAGRQVQDQHNQRDNNDYRRPIQHAAPEQAHPQVEHHPGPPEDNYFGVMNRLLTQNQLMLEMLQRNTPVARNDNRNMNIIPDLSQNISTFDGESGPEVAEAWLQRLTNAAVLHNWPLEYLYETACSKLRGAASFWLQGNNHIVNWPIFNESFRRRFLYRKSMTEMWQKMRDRVQKPKENVSFYFHEKVALCKQLGLTFDETKEQVASGVMSRELSTYILSREHYNEDHIFQDLIQYERFEQDRRNRFGNKPHVNHVKKTFSGPAEKVESSENTVSDTGNVKDKASRRKCFNCNQVGHNASECEKEKQPVKCFKCGEVGHFAKSCPRNKFVEKKYEVRVIEDTPKIDTFKKYLKEVTVNDVQLAAMVDTGSSSCTITASSVIKGQFAVEPISSEFIGFGNSNNIVKSYGVVTATVSVDRVCAKNVTFRIVPDNVQNTDVIIGRTFTELPHISYYKVDNEFCFRERDDFLQNFPETISIEARANLQCGQGQRLPAAEINFVKTILGQDEVEFPVSNFSKESKELRPGDVLDRSVVNVTRELHPLESMAEPIKMEELNCGETVTPEEKVELLNLMNDFRECVAKDIFEVGKTTLLEMEIKEIEGSKPVQCKPYRASLSEREKMSEILQEWKKAGIVEETTSTYASPVLLVKKKNGESRLVVDYRHLNRQTEKVSFPLPSLDECCEVLHGSKIFITLDLAHGYLQLPISEQSREKTAFVTPDETGQFTRAIFGLMNSPYYFSKLMQLALGPIRNKLVIFYLDDMLIPGKDWSELMYRLKCVLELLRAANLTLRLKKCNFGMKSIEFLGMLVSADGLQPGADKRRAIELYPRPQDVHGIRRFIEPLTRLTNNGVQFVWTQEQEDSFVKLKQVLISAPVLQMYNPKSKVTELHTDASSRGIAAILFQECEDDGKLHPVHAVSRRTTEAEKSYHSGKLELLAMVWSVERLRIYLTGIKFVIFTDCKALTYLNTNKTKNAQIMRWYSLLSEYNFEIRYRPAEKMQHVDALSRDPVEDEVLRKNDPEDKFDVFVMMTREDEVALYQYSDPELKQKIIILRKNATERTKVEKSVVNGYSLRDGLLYKEVRDEEQRKYLFIIPKKMRKSIAVKYHDLSGHFGLEKTLQKIQEFYYFPKMKNYIKQHVASCLECILAKNRSGRQEGYLNPIPPGVRPFDIVHVDHLGPFPTSRKGNRYVLLVIDNLTKYVKLYPVKNTKAQTSVKRLEEFIDSFGAPNRLISDRGTSFTATEFENFCRRRGTKHTKNSSRHPQANGLVERLNRTLLPMMQIESGIDVDQWDNKMKFIEQQMNSTVNKTTGKIPFEVLFGFIPRYGDDPVREITSQDKYTLSTEVQEKVKKRIEEGQEKYRQAFDKRRFEGVKYGLGDIVFVKSNPIATGESTKLQSRFKGPFVVSQVYPSDTYGITKLISNKNEVQKTTAHVSQLKVWRGHQDEADESDVEESVEGSDENIKLRLRKNSEAQDF